MNTFELLKELTETPGPSGFENRVSDLVKSKWRPLVDEVAVDRVGSLVALKTGSGSEPRSKIMLAAHMDEIGLMVTNLESYPETGSGFLRVINVGGIDIRQLFGQTVVVHGTKKERRDLTGVLGSLPSRMLPKERRDKSIGFDDLVVDLGLSVQEIKEAVEIGDFVSFRQPLRKLLNKRATGKSLDNRVSLVVLTKCLEMLGKRSHSWDVLAVATAQEETALLGAYTSAFDLEPNVAIAVDVTWAKGPGVTEEPSYNLGSGPSIGIGPNVHPGVFKGLRAAADRIEIEVHLEPHARMSGTDASGLQMARAGIPTGIVSVPLRYMHMSTETVSMVDIKRASRLITEFIADLDDTFIDKIQDSLMEIG